jgi:hypothetical protein
MNDDSEIFGSRGDLTARDFALIELYLREGQPLDRLPYTESFDRIYSGYLKVEPGCDRAAVWQRLLYIRKSGRLPRHDFGQTG